MGLGGLAGLASGVDTNALVDQLMALERQRLTRLRWQQSAEETRASDLRGVATKLTELQGALDALRSTGSSWSQSQTVSSSDAARVEAVKISGAGIGGHTIEVDRLASSAQRTFSWSLGADGATTAETTLAITPNGGTATTVTFAAGTTLADIVEAVNARDDLAVYAAEVGGELVLSSRTTGDGSVFAVGGTLVGGGTLAQVSEKTTNLNALYRLDGETTQRSSPSNRIEDGIAGLRLTLKGVTSSPVTVTVGEPALDKEAVKEKVTAVVDAYNALLSTVSEHTTERSVAAPENAFDAAQGVLYGDIGLVSMLSQLRRDITGVVSGLTGVDDLSDLGISVPKTSGGASTEDALEGKLVIDDEALTQALDADWTQVRAFFDGFAEKIETFVSAQTGNGTGILDDRAEGADRAVDRIADRMTRMEERLEMKEERMRAQFAAMELALQQAQTQQAWLTGQIAALNRTAP